MVSLPSACNPTKGWIPPANKPMLRAMMAHCCFLLCEDHARNLSIPHAPGAVDPQREGHYMSRRLMDSRAKHAAARPQCNQLTGARPKSYCWSQMLSHRTTGHSPAAQLPENCLHYSHPAARRYASAPTTPWPEALPDRAQGPKLFLLSLCKPCPKGPRAENSLFPAKPSQNNDIKQASRQG